MSRESYFQSALSNFIFEVACGGAIRHLAGQGLTSRQIADRLSFPMSYERVREAVTKYYLEEGILLCREPARGEPRKKYVYVQDHGKYGKTSFRRVQVKEGQGSGEHGGAGSQEAGGVWTECAATCRELADLLRRSGTGGAEKNYVSCGFGRIRSGLDERQQEYLDGICWESCPGEGRSLYHLLDARMSEIVVRLCEKDLFCGRVYWMSARKIFVVAENKMPERTEEK